MKTQKETISDLKLLFECVSPEKLKDTITTVLLQHLMTGTTLKKEVYQDIYFLFDFLDKQKDVNL